MRLLHIDAFTSQAFRGNPAAVCLLPDERNAEREERWMQDVAAEMNLSETAFLLRREDGDYSLRWFTPAVEVALCGHATLASAQALYEEHGLASARFHTKSELLESLGIAAPLYVGRNKFDYIIEVASEDEVRALDPDHGQLRRIPVRGIIVTSRSASNDFDFVSRFFAPGSGVDEDPVTGSAHCCLTPYWSAKLGKDEMTAYQASRRGGVVRLRLAGDRVKLAGEAVTVLRGRVGFLPPATRARICRTPMSPPAKAGGYFLPPATRARDPSPRLQPRERRTRLIAQPASRATGSVVHTYNPIP